MQALAQTLADDIRTADFTRDDVDGFLAYWYDGEASSLSAHGVDPTRLPSRAKMREMLEWNLERNAMRAVTQNPILSIKLGTSTIGVHELTHLVPAPGGRAGHASAIMHAHIWRAEHRGRGFGLVSYVRAMQTFFERFELECVLFESPATNPGANRIKEKLGIRAVGTGEIRLSMLGAPLATRTYEVRRTELPALVARMQACVGQGAAGQGQAAATRTGLPEASP